MLEGEKMQSYKDLIAYQKGYKLTLKVYQITKDYPRDIIQDNELSGVRLHIHESISQEVNGYSF
jgi:hypothetical protein